MEHATNYTQVKVPTIYEDIVPIDIRSRQDDLSPLKPNSNDGGGGGRCRQLKYEKSYHFGQESCHFWNIRTLYAVGAAVVLVKELERLRWDVIGLAETHWTGAQEYWVQDHQFGKRE